MDVLDNEPRPRRRRPVLALVVAVALGLVAVGQAAALVRTPPLTEDVGISALPNGYSYATRGSALLFGFQLVNDGDRDLRVLDLGRRVEGLEILDVVVSGEPFAYMTAGEGPDPVPAFRLERGTVVEVTLVYRVTSCRDVPAAGRALTVVARDGRSEGRLQVPLPTAPSDDEDAGPDDEDQWQQVLVRDVCG